MDKTTYQYNPNETYPAHEQVLDVYSDELWSTPLFQALVALVDAGRSREEVDKIILESHFGLGANLKMPDLAYATIQAACVLYPTGPHAEVFRQKFDQVNIIDASANLAPVARVSAASISTQTGASVTLNASDSSDPDCEDITFSWTQTGGTSVSLSSSTAAAPTFTAPSSAGTLTFQVTVSDGTDADVATVTVNVRGTDSGGGGGGALGWLATAGLAGLLGLRVKRRQ